MLILRRVLIALVVLGALFVALDRVAARLAEKAVAHQLAASQRLTTDPTVTVPGFPFLLQAVRGRYDEIDVTVPELDRQGVRVQDLRAQLRGVRVPLSQALARRVSAVPVESVSGQARIAYADLVSAGGGRLMLAPAGDQLRVTGSVRFLGQALRATAYSAVRLDGQDVRVTGQRFEVGNGAVNGVLTAVLRDRLDLRVPVGPLPYGLRLTDVSVAADGLHVSASGGPTVISPR